MNRLLPEIKEFVNPLELIERPPSTPTGRDVQICVDWYHDLTYTIMCSFLILLGAATLVFLAYLVYHIISKLRGNEKNVQMNNFGIALAVLGLVNYSIIFMDTLHWAFYEGKHDSWVSKHEVGFYWIIWLAESSGILYHWFFNLRYVKSTFRMPLLQKGAEFFSEMLERILEQREEQHVVFTAQELEDHSTEMAELKKRQVRQETWADVIQGVFLLLVAVSAYTSVYVDYQKTLIYFQLMMSFLLNLTMLIAVVVMRFVIKRMPNLLPNENVIIVHVILYTASTTLWIF